MPVSRSGLPAATSRPWSRCTSRTTADSAPVRPAPRSIQIRQRVLAGGRVEQVRAGQVAQPVAQRDQPAERPDVRRRQRQQRVGGAQRGGGQVQHQVVRADRDDRALDVGQPAQQLAPGPARRRGDPPPRPARPAGRPRGRARSARRPRAAGVSPRASTAPTRPRRTRTQSSEPMAEASLRASRARGRRPLPRGRALERGQQRRGEDVEGQRGRDRVAGAPSIGVRASGWPDRRRRAQHDRVPGTHGDAVHGQRAGGRDHAARCSRRVRRSSPAMTITRSASTAASRTAAAISSGSSGTIAVRPGLAADLARPARRASASWCRRSRPGQVGADRADLVAGRDDHHPAACGAPRSSTRPAAAQAATSTGRSRWPSGSSSSVALTSSPIERTCW